MRVKEIISATINFDTSHQSATVHATPEATPTTTTTTEVTHRAVSAPHLTATALSTETTRLRLAVTPANTEATTHPQLT